MKFFMTRAYWSNWFVGLFYILVLKPISYIIMGPYLEAVQQAQAAKQVKEFYGQLKTAQEEAAKKRGN